MEYQCFVKSSVDLEEGRKVVLTIRDLSPGRRKYNARVVRAVVSRAADALARWDRLWVRSMVGLVDPDPWALRVVEELGPAVPGRPYSDLFEALERLDTESAPPRAGGARAADGSR
jgi:hypothetical protein